MYTFLKMNIYKTLFTLLILALIGCSSDPAQNSKNSSQQSSDHTASQKKLFNLLSHEKSGVDFRNDLADDPVHPWKNVMGWQHYFNGAGVAVGDLNNDGLQDLVFSGNEVENRIYINKGNLEFEDVTETANINIGKNWTTGVSLADVNQDGFLDIYFCQASAHNRPSSERKNLLFISNGDLTFSERSKELGLADSNHSVQAQFFDMDNDGDLDCFVHNTSKYVFIQMGEIIEDLKDDKNLREASSNLYRNDNGKFTKITEEAGILQWGFALGNFISDINEDGYLDIYQANDYSVADFMYINQGDGTFKDEIKERTKQISWFAMGADCADINNDAKLDIGVVDMAATDHVRGKTLMAPMDPELFYLSIDYFKRQRQHMFNTLQLNNGDNTFSNIAGLAHVQKSEWSWAAFFADFDNDTYKDYFVATGYRRYSRDNDSRNHIRKIRQSHGGSVPVNMRQELYDLIPQVKLKNFIYHNSGDLEFHEIADEWGLEIPNYSNGAAYCDFDNDGDLDLVINNIDDFAHIYENTLDGTKNYLRVNLNSDDPIEGARVYIEYDGKVQVQEYGPVRGYLSVIEPVLHFGLAEVGSVDLRVIWPNQKMQILKQVNANQVLTLNSSDANLNYQPETQRSHIYFEDRPSPFRHVENIYNDYEVEVLVPYQQSAIGPGISIADVNNDGLEDFYVGGAKDQTGSIFYQKPDGTFKYDYSAFVQNKNKEEMGSCLFDADGDGDNDLYVINGGNEFKDQPAMLQDKFYINDGNGNFKDESFRLPKIEDAGYKVKPADFDGDGDLDLFVGGRLVPGLYPNPARSYLLRNDDGYFTDVTEEMSTELLRPGLVNDFLWTDFNGDDKVDLIIAGEWMPISMFENTGSGFANVTDNHFDQEYSGWWYGLHEADIDNDGDLDLIAGNLGLNSKFKASEDHPFEVLANDFDSNGTCDIVLTKDYKGKKVPVRGRQCSSEQMPFILDKFETYQEFADASIQDILGQANIEDALKLQVNTFRSAIFINENGKYSESPLPNIAQAFPIYGIETFDLNKDGLLDIIIGGNIYNMEIETPRLDAGNGLTLINKGEGNFEPVGIETGLRASLDCKDVRIIKGRETQLLIVNNNGPLQVYQINPISVGENANLTAIK